jgi:Flp pilus assembly protein TadD
MSWEALNRLFQQALKAFRDGRLVEAAAGFRRILDCGSTDPRHLSYGGLVLVIAEGKVKEGLELCEQAVEVASYDPQMFINLARLHADTGWKSRAAEVLRKGLRLHPDDVALLRELRRINPRSRPPLGFLDRNHPLNKHLGILRAQLVRAGGR